MFVLLSAITNERSTFPSFQLLPSIGRNWWRFAGENFISLLKCNQKSVPKLGHWLVTPRIISANQQNWTHKRWWSVLMTLDGDIYSEMKEASNSLKIIFYCDNVKRWRPNEHGLALNYKLFFAKNIHQSNSNSNVRYENAATKSFWQSDWGINCMICWGWYWELKTR